MKMHLIYIQTYTDIQKIVLHYIYLFVSVLVTERMSMCYIYMLNLFMFLSLLNDYVLSSDERIQS